MAPDAPTDNPQRWARVLLDHHRDYPASYSGQWFRIVERHDPEVPLETGYVWLDLAGVPERVRGSHFEIVERTKRRILVVDDDPGIRQTVHIALSNTGYEVLQARDGEEATRLCHEAAPDLVITDIHMPRKSGLLLIQDLQEHSSSSRIIVMTDGGPAQDFKLFGLAQMLGAVRTIAKPFTLDDMVNAVRLELSR
ncbi:MAG TPA: response regulator [Gemmatimonadales bacterium]